MARLLAPRRILVAFLLAFAGGGVAAAVVAGSADSAGPAQAALVPETFGLPAMASGDRGEYDLVLGDGEAASFLRFEVRGPLVQRDREGVAHAVLALDVLETSERTVGGGQKGKCTGHCSGSESYSTYFLDEGSIVAFSDARTKDWGDGEYWVETTTHLGRPGESRENSSLPSGNLLCGLLNGFQGNEMRLEAELPLLPDLPCAILVAGTSSGTRMHFDSFSVDNATSSLWVNETRRGEQSLALRFAPGIPYPVEIHVGSARAVLSRFQAGIPAADAPVLPPPVNVHRWEPVPRDVWGPSEEGVQVPFALSEAFTAARDHPRYTGLRDFLREHPDAFVYQAWGSEMRQSSDLTASTRHIWTFSLHEDGDRLNVCVEQRSRAYGPVALPPLPGGLLPDSGIIVQDGEMCADGQLGKRLPEPQDLPAKMPRLAPLLDLWPAYGPERAGPVAQEWGFTCYCPEETDCSAPRLQMWVGRGLRDDLFNGTITGTETSDMVYSRLFVKPEGPTAIGEWTIREGMGPAPVSAPKSQDLPPASASAGRLRLPPSAVVVAAGTSLAGVLAAIGYLLWPVAKNSLLLFSRIEPPRALEHPARARLAAIIQASPGVHGNEMARIAGMPRGTVAHHLRALVQAGHVVERQGPHYTCYFPKGTPRGARAGSASAKSPGARALLSAVEASPGLHVAEAARRIGLSRQVAHMHAQTLAGSGALRIDHAGRNVRLYPLLARGYAAETAA